MCTSVPQMEATLTLTRTSVRPNLGLGTSRISVPGADSGFTTASMVFGMKMAFRRRGMNSIVLGARRVSPRMNRKRWANGQVYHAPSATEGALCHRDHIDFHQHIFRQPGDFDGGAGRWGLGEVAAIDLVHRCKVRHVFQEDAGLDHAIQG